MPNEITVRLTCSVDEIIEFLKNKGFKLARKFILNDTYFIPRELNIEEMTPREILKKAILLRNIIIEIPQREHIVKLTFKEKDIDTDGQIIKQSKVDCNILDKEEGKSFLKKIGYRELMTIKELDTEYSREELTIAIKDIVNGEKLIEVETVDSNEKIDTVEKLKQEVAKLQMPIDTSDYFIKKAEIELCKILNKRS